MSKIPAITLNDGFQIPQLGFGTWQLNGDECVQATSKAIELGYRHIDTASIYHNEAEVGKAIAESGLAREDLFVVSKLWNNRHLHDDARFAIERSLNELKLDYLDLYLIHWPATVEYGDSYIEAWDALQEFQAEGLVRSIGVSNFHAHHIEKLNGATPAIDQIELHPAFSQKELRDYLRHAGIAVECYSPLGRGNGFGNATINAIAGELGRNPAQVILRWHIQHGLIVIPRSKSADHIASNADIFDFELSAAQMAAIDGLTTVEGRIGQNPDFADFSK